MSNNRNRRRRKPGGTSHVRELAGAPGVFTFTHEGKAYTLPPAAEAAQQIPAGDVIDAVTGNEELAEIRMGLATLMAAGVDAATMQALRSMPMGLFSDIVGRWMRSAGVDPGKSEGSSN